MQKQAVTVGGSSDMTRQLAIAPTRLFVLAMFAAVGLVPRMPAADATSYYPDGTMLVVSFSFKPFLEARLVRDSSGARSMVEEMKKAFAAIGVDVTNDLDRVVLVV